jgi:hypothetical protein
VRIRRVQAENTTAPSPALRLGIHLAVVHGLFAID